MDDVWQFVVRIVKEGGFFPQLFFGVIMFIVATTLLPELVARAVPPRGKRVWIKAYGIVALSFVAAFMTAFGIAMLQR